MGLNPPKTCLRCFANNKGADQTALMFSLIIAFVIRSLEGSISKLATSEITNFLASLCIAEETGLSPALSETPKTGFVTSRPI